MIILNGLLSSDSQPGKKSFYNDFDGDTRTSLSVLSGIVMFFVSLEGENGGDKVSRKVAGFFVAREFSTASSAALVEDCETKIQMVHKQVEGKLDVVDYWGVLHFIMVLQYCQM